MRIGVLGCGEVANFGHIPAIRSTGGLDLVALYDPNPERLAATTARHGHIPAFGDIDEFFAQNLDAITIASPAPAHRENVLRAAKEGVHVLCEKPISEDEDEAKEMIAAMEATSKLFAIGFCYRFSPVARQIKQWIEDKAVGTIRSLRFIYIWNLHGRYEPGPDGKWIESPRWRGRMLEGGPMVDCGVHMIDLARWWLQSEPVRCTGAGAWVADYESPDHIWLHLDHEKGEHSMVEMSFTYCHTAHDPINTFTYHLIGDGGVLRYDRDGYILEARTGQETIRVPGASEKNFEGMYETFVQAVHSGDYSLMPTATDGLIATRIARTGTEALIANRMRQTAQ